MKYLFAAVVMASSVATFSAADAAGGCGGGFHRDYYGRCVPNRAVYVAPRPVVVAPPIYVAPRPVVRPARVCPYGYVWRYGGCRLY